MTHKCTFRKETFLRFGNIYEEFLPKLEFFVNNSTQFWYMPSIFFDRSSIVWAICKLYFWVKVFSSSVLVLGWPKNSFQFFCKVLWKTPKELFNQPQIICILSINNLKSYHIENKLIFFKLNYQKRLWKPNRKRI